MRNRSSAVAITGNTKKKMRTETGIENFSKDEEKIEKLTSYLENQIAPEDIRIPSSSGPSDRFLELAPPKFQDHKKEYLTKNDKPIKFHDCARLVGGLDRKYVDDIESYLQQIDFQTFLYQYKSEEEIQQLEIQDLLNLDYEKLGELKERTSSFIQHTTRMIQTDENDENKQNLLMFFCDKLKQLKKNEGNVQLLITNIEKVEKLTFGDKYTKVSFST